MLREPEALPADASATGSRRRLWELDGHAHCPVVGVCLPLAALRRVTNKVLGGDALAGDYELHCGVIAECKPRTPLAEAVQKQLDAARRRWSTRCWARCTCCSTTWAWPPVWN